MAKDYQRLHNEVSEMNKSVDQLQLIIRESKDETAKLEWQKIRLQNFVKNFQDNNIEYNNIKHESKEKLKIFLQIVNNR